MNSPWNEIDLNVYEAHMSSDNVMQLQMLNNITKHQLTDHEHCHVAILGAAGGNGLSNIDMTTTKKVYAIDMNSKYLEICKQRYSSLGNILELICCDLADVQTILPFSDILICNLIIEYLGEYSFVELLHNNKGKIRVVSCVIQRNNGKGFVSSSNLASALDPILSIHHNIDENVLQKEIIKASFEYLKKVIYPLPNGKEFVRMDFMMQ